MREQKDIEQKKSMKLTFFKLFLSFVRELSSSLSSANDCPKRGNIWDLKATIILLITKSLINKGLNKGGSNTIAKIKQLYMLVDELPFKIELK